MEVIGEVIITEQHLSIYPQILFEEYLNLHLKVVEVIQISNYASQVMYSVLVSIKDLYHLHSSYVRSKNLHTIPLNDQ